MTLQELSKLYYLREEINNSNNITADVIKKIKERDRLENYIFNISDSLTRQIFVGRFVENMTWRQVANRIGGNNTADSVRMICKRYIKKERD